MIYLSVFRLNRRQQLDVITAMTAHIDKLINLGRWARDEQATSGYIGEAVRMIRVYRRLTRLGYYRKWTPVRADNWERECSEILLDAVAGAQNSTIVRDGALDIPDFTAVRNVAYEAVNADDICPDCGVRFGSISSECPRVTFDRHPGTLHDDGRRY